MWILSPAQKELEERVRTASVFITALGVLGAALYFLRPALLPLVLAVALKHLLQPVINVLSVRPVVCCGRTLLARPLVQGTRPRQGKRLQAACDYACRLQLPRGAAIVVALLLSLMVLGLLAAIVAESVHVFAERADVYARQVKVLLGRVLGWVEYFSCSWTPKGCPGNATDAVNATGNATDSTADRIGSELEQLLSRVPVTQLVLGIVESLLEMASNLFLVSLFTIYLLLGRPSEAAERTQVDQQVLEYIKGKVVLSALIGVCTAFVLLAIGLDLWLVFGTLAFWLNFVPNVGAVIATLLPLPLVLLDPSMPAASMVLAFVLPFCVHMFVGNVLEPLLFGHSLELHPVVILLALMIWGTLWGVVGMILAVPLTAILKIYLSAIDHPLAAVAVRLLVSGGHDETHLSASAPSQERMQERTLQAAEDALVPLDAVSLRGRNSMETTTRRLLAERQVSLTSPIAAEETDDTV